LLAALRSRGGQSRRCLFTVGKGSTQPPVRSMTRILVVDDDNRIRSALRVALERSGYDVEEAATGPEALQRFGSQTYDAAVVDYHLPPPDGLEILVQLREMQPRCVRLLMSGALDVPVVISAVNRGEVSRVLAKPFGGQSVLAAIEEAIAARNRAEELSIGDRNTAIQSQRAHLEECFRGDYLKLALQPIVEARSGAIFGYEALLRSHHPFLDTPMRILAAAEAQHALGRLGGVVVSRALDWLRVLPPQLNLFINVHPHELAETDAVRERFSALQPLAARVVLEITERSSMLQMEGWRGSLDFLMGAGFPIAVDDLGSGYNSLSMLAELQPAFIKVDMGIVRHIDRDERKQRLVELLARFAKSTGSRLVAEGIETLDEAETVKGIGVDLLQGYLFGRPTLAIPDSHGAP
jgi:EAL domain-containing protein (putative c-di-GMP-specific phosphodiesterase class I)